MKNENETPMKAVKCPHCSKLFCKLISGNCIIQTKCRGCRRLIEISIYD
jgi:phage FluMu protein Com